MALQCAMYCVGGPASVQSYNVVLFSPLLALCPVSPFPFVRPPRSEVIRDVLLVGLIVSSGLQPLLSSKKIGGGGNGFLAV